jgi:hypothetical protein
VSPSTNANPARTPWQVWVVAIMTFLWNGSGMYTIVMAFAFSLISIAATTVYDLAAKASLAIVDAG